MVLGSGGELKAIPILESGGKAKLMGMGCILGPTATATKANSKNV